MYRSVHDENSWALNGVSGHAGVFSTAADLGVMCQMILNNGTYNGVKVLEPWTVDLIFENFNTKCKSNCLSHRLVVTAPDSTTVPSNAHGLGFELNQTYWSGPMRSLHTAGHTGFTGTTLWIDRPSGTFAVQLASRVHPSRKWSSTNISRQYIGKCRS
jgi:CubicO group peptidase (beta-lactamase class C family)